MADAAGAALLDEHRAAVLAAVAAGDRLPDYPEEALRPRLHDTWRADTERFFAAWLDDAVRGAP